MLSIRQLNTAIDSISHIDSIYLKKSNAEVNPYLNFTRYADTGWAKVDPKKSRKPAALPNSFRIVLNLLYWKEQRIN